MGDPFFEVGLICQIVRCDPDSFHGQKRQRQLLEKEKLDAGDLFSFLTAHANGRPLFRILH